MSKIGVLAHKNQQPGRTSRAAGLAQHGWKRHPLVRTRVTLVYTVVGLIRFDYRATGPLQVMIPPLTFRTWVKPIACMN